MRLTALFPAAVLTATALAQAAPTINLSGTVKNSKGASVPQAIVSLVSNPAMKATTNESGAFTLNSTTSINTDYVYKAPAQRIGNVAIQGNQLRFFIPAQAQKGTIALFSSNGKRVVESSLATMNPGMQSYILPALAPGFYALNITIDKTTASYRLIAAAGNKMFVSDPKIKTSGSFITYGSVVDEVVDTLEVTKTGYTTVKYPLSSYELDNIEIKMDSTSTADGDFLFAKALGKTKTECDTKIQSIINLYFKNGANKPNGSKLYNENGNEAYIEDVEFDDVRSEGQSYGMMIAVQMNMQSEFDKIWAWTKNHMRRGDGMFNWQCTPSGQVKGNDYATDGEEWFIMCLHFAHQRWGDSKYKSDADAVSNAMFSNGAFNNNLPVFVRGNPTVDPSYILPAFYTLLSKWSGNHQSDWANMAKAGRRHLAGCVNTSTGLMVGSPTTNIPFDWDAWRTAQNIVQDIWLSDLYFNGAARADYGDWRGSSSGTDKSFITNWCNTFLGFWEKKRDAKGYWPLWSLDGNSKYGDNNQNKTGLRPGLAAMNAYAANYATAKASDGTPLAEKFAKDLWDIQPPTDDQYIYYDGLLYTLGMLHATGNWKIFGSEKF
ncbi:MAG: hypothetical protein GX639_21135 [Fibrobacter sp.]|nr:hypothetical protein [Fibrobacter sp.]